MSQRNSSPAYGFDRSSLGTRPNPQNTDDDFAVARSRSRAEPGKWPSWRFGPFGRMSFDSDYSGEAPSIVNKSTTCREVGFLAPYSKEKVAGAEAPLRRLRRSIQRAKALLRRRPMPLLWRPKRSCLEVEMRPRPMPYGLLPIGSCRSPLAGRALVGQVRRV